MVGSAFIHTQRPNGCRTLINVNQVASIYTTEVDLASKDGQYGYKQYAPEQGMLYTIQVMLTSRREMEYLFTTAVDRDTLYNQFVAALAPSVTLEFDTPQPKLKEKEPVPEEKLYTKDEVFCTREEFERAIAQVLARQQPTSPAFTPPAPTKPPRKPRTPRQ